MSMPRSVCKIEEMDSDRFTLKEAEIGELQEIADRVKEAVMLWSAMRCRVGVG